MRLNLNMSKILVAANQIPPFIQTNYKPNTTIIVSLEGYEGNIIHTLSKCLNFTIEIVNCNRVWGTQQPDGTWNGLIGAVYEQRADLAIGAITLTQERAEVIRYSFPHFINTVTFTTALPQRSSYSSTLLGPFEEQIWFCLLSFVIIIFFISFCFNERTQKNSQIRWTIISIILSQPIYSFKSRLLSLRSLVCGWLLSALILKNYYCGELFGLMAITSEKDRIETISEFGTALKAEKLKIITFKGSNFYMTKINGIDLASNESQKYKKNVDNFNEIFAMMRENPRKYSLIGERNGIDYYLNLAKVPQYLPPKDKESNIYLELQGVVLQKQSILEKDINRCLSEMKENGLIDFWYNQYFWRKFKKFNTKDVNKNEEKFNELNLNQLLYSFKTVLFGFCSAVILLIVELLFKHSLSQTSNRRTLIEQAQHYTKYYTMHKRKWF